MRELVLGGSGLIGSELVRILGSKGHQVAVADLHRGIDLRCASGEIYENCDRVWFLAWDTGGAKYLEDAQRQHAIYLHSTRLCCEVFDRLAECKKPFLFTTSQLAGRDDAYGITKLLGEKWAKCLGGKVARLWNVYGWEEPSVRSHVITDIVLSALSVGEISCRTSGEERRRFLYKRDCAVGLIKLMESDTQVADFAGDRWLTIRELCETVAKLTSCSFSLGSGKGTEAMIDPSVTLKNWASEVSLSEGLGEVIAEARAYLRK